MNNGYKFGKFLGAIEAGVNPASLSYMEGKHEKIASDGEQPARMLLKYAYDVMRMAGKSDTKAASHIKWAHDMPTWNAHCQEVADTVGLAICHQDPPGQVKQAILGQIFESGVDAAKGLGNLALKTPQTLYTAAALGGGTGGLLYWLLRREAQRDNKDIQSLQNQVDLYNELGSEIEQSLKRRYRYNDDVADKRQQRPEAQQQASRSFGSTRGSTASAV